MKVGTPSILKFLREKYSLLADIRIEFEDVVGGGLRFGIWRGRRCSAVALRSLEFAHRCSLLKVYGGEGLKSATFFCRSAVISLSTILMAGHADFALGGAQASPYFHSGTCGLGEKLTKELSVEIEIKPG